MAGGNPSSLALLLTAAPYRSREPRAELDVALAGLALDRRIEVYFLDEAVLQLALNREAGDALLPPGYAAWPALPELGEARIFADTEWMKRCADDGVELSEVAEPLSTEDMRRRWRRCDRVMVL